MLHVAAQVVSDCNMLLSPFLPHSARRCGRRSAARASSTPLPRIEHVEEPDPDQGAGLLTYPVITGDYSRHARAGNPCR